MNESNLDDPGQNFRENPLFEGLINFLTFTVSPRRIWLTLDDTDLIVISQIESDTYTEFGLDFSGKKCHPQQSCIKIYKCDLPTNIYIETMAFSYTAIRPS